MQKIKHYILIVLCKINFAYPILLGWKFFVYKKYRLGKNYFHFNQTKDLIKIFNDSIKTTPYYQKRYKNEISSINEFEKSVSFIDKETVMSNWRSFQSKLKENKSVQTTTGGTSGKPLKLILPKNRYVFELATMYRMWYSVGWKGQIRAVIRNKKLKTTQKFIIDPIKREFIFDGFRSTREYYYEIYQTLKKHNIGFIHAYPSSAYQFSQFLFKEKLNTSFIKAFLCGSEGITEEQKQLIREVLGIKIYHWYGHSEKLVLGGYCKDSDLIHVEPTYGYFELINEQGAVVDNIGEIGEIVGTTFHNKYMPLIRYRTGDYAEYAGDFCHHCNRKLPLLKKVYGRWDKNKIFKKDGSYITTTALNLHSELYLKIEGIQYVQDKVGELKVKVIKGDGFNKGDLEKLKKHFENSFGEENSIEIIFVLKLEKLPNGKFQNLISNL